MKEPLMTPAMASPLFPSALEQNAKADLKGLSQQLNRLLSKQEVDFLCSPCCSLEILLQRLSATISENKLEEVMTCLSGQVEYFRECTPKDRSTKRLALCYLMASQLKKVEQESQQKKERIIATARVLWHKKETFLCKELFCRVAEEKTFRCLVRHHQNEDSLLDMVAKANGYESMIECLLDSQELLQRRSYAPLGIIFGELLRAENIQETEELALQSGREVVFRALQSVDGKGRSPLLYCIQKQCQSGLEWIQKWLGKEACLHPLVKQGPTTPLASWNMELASCLQHCSGSVAQWIEAVLASYMNEAIDPRLRQGTVLVFFLHHHALELAQWVAAKIGPEKARQKLLSYVDGKRAFALASPYDVERHRFLYREISAIEQFKWLEEILGKSQFTQLLDQYDELGQTPLLWALMAGDLTTAKWIAEQLDQGQLSNQLLGMDKNQGGRVRRNPLATIRCDVADWIAIKIGPEATMAYLESASGSGRPLLIDFLLMPVALDNNLCLMLKWQMLGWIAEKLGTDRTVVELLARYGGKTPLVLLLEHNQTLEGSWVISHLTRYQVAAQLEEVRQDTGFALTTWLAIAGQHDAVRWIKQLEADLSSKSSGIDIL